MATYGGGIGFVNTKTSTNVGASSSVALYTVPTGAYYSEVVGLSVNDITAVGPAGHAGCKFTVYNDDGIGGYLPTAFSFVIAPNTIFPLGGSIIPTSPSVGQVLKLMPGQRLVAENAIGFTMRFTYSINEFYPAS